MNMKDIMNMENLMTIVISLLIGGIISCHLFCGCATFYKTTKEGFSSMGAPIGWNMGSGVPGDVWANPQVSKTQANENMYADLSSHVGGPVPPENMFMWAKNLFLPECCFTPQQYSSSTGCACISNEQMKFISGRGGNNTLP